MDKVTSSIVYAKAWIVSIGAVISAVLVGLAAANIGVPAWLPIASIILTAVGTISVPNEPSDAVKQKVINNAVADPNSPVTISTVTAPVEVAPVAAPVTIADQLTGH